MGLSENAMLVELSIRQCAFRKLDKKVSQEVNWNKNASSAAARVNKSLIKKEFIQPLQKIASSARVYHYETTLPFTDSGQRILPIRMHQEYSEKMNGFINEFNQAVEELLGNYNNAVEDAKGFLGALYNAGDYPGIETVRGKFEISISFSTVPEISTLGKLSGVSKDEMESLRKNVIDSEKKRTEKAMRDLWERLYNSVSAVSETLKQDGRIFRNSLIENMERIIDILPKMNITGNSDLERMAEEVKNSLCGASPDTLRKDKMARKETAEAAEKLANTMSVYF